MNGETVDGRQVINANLTVDDVQSLSAAYGLTLGRNGNPKPPRSAGLAKTAQMASGSTPDLRSLEQGNLKSIRDSLLNSHKSSPLKSSSSSHHHPDSVINRLKEENHSLKREAAAREAKLQANIRSIRTFWSPELKKERNSRKDEQSRANRLESELRLQHDERPENILLRENNVLRRAVADLEARVQVQRETLEAREVSLRRALQLAAAHESHGMQKGVQSEETLRALLTIKDDKIGALERCVRELETQLRRPTEDSQLLNAHNNFLKTKSDGLKCELSVKEAEITSLKTRLDATQRSNEETRIHVDALRESLSAKTSRSMQLQSENDKLRDRLITSNKPVESHITCFPANRRTALDQEMEVKNHHITMLTNKCESLEIAIAEKERRIIELEQRLKHTEGSHIRDEKNSAEANMAIKALEDALSEKDSAMERERDRLNKEVENERLKRMDLQNQIDNPEEVEREKQQMNRDLKTIQKQAQMAQQALGEQDQRAGKAEAAAARLSSQMEELLKEFEETKRAYLGLQQKYMQMRRVRKEDERIIQAAKTEAATHCLNELEARAQLLDLKGKTNEAKQVREQRSHLEEQLKL